jgi:hypothetical protein
MSTFVHVYPVYEMYLHLGKSTPDVKSDVNTKCRIFDLTSMNAALCTISAQMWGRLRPTAFVVRPIMEISSDRKFMYQFSATFDLNRCLLAKPTLEEIDRMKFRRFPEDRDQQRRYNQVLNWHFQGYGIDTIVLEAMLSGWYVDPDTSIPLSRTAR